MGTFRLVTLGTGTGIPGPRRPPAHLVVAGDRMVLMDTGPGTLWQLADAGVEFQDIDVVLYSHLHPDHFSGFVPFMFASRSPEFGRSSPVLVVGPEGLMDAYQGLRTVFGSWIELPGDMLEMRELSLSGADGFNAGDLRIDSLPVDHSDGLGFRLTFRERVLAYSGDSGYSENLVALAKDADLFLCECAMPDHQPVPMHLTPKTAGRAAGAARAKRLVLTHLYPVVDPGDAELLAAKESGVETTVARDLEVFDIG